MDMDPDERERAKAAFVQLVLTSVRDRSINQVDVKLRNITIGPGKTSEEALLHELITAPDSPVGEALRLFIPRVVDVTVFYMLWLCEVEPHITLRYVSDTHTIPDIRWLSDGLAGELVDLIPQFSHERYDPEL